MIREEITRRGLKLTLIIVVWVAALSAAHRSAGQEVTLSPTPSASPEPIADATGAIIETDRVVVTGSNIPTAEEVGPNPVDTYRTGDIEKLGVRTATDLTRTLPAVTGGSVNENISNGGDGRTEVNLRGLFAKETLVLVDGRRVAPVGIAQNASVDLNLVPFALVDHIDILKDGASAIYGSDAVGGVFNAVLKHKFRGLELSASYGNTNLGSSNDGAERSGYLLAGTGDDKTDIVVFADDYDRAAIFSRDRDISSTADFRRYGGIDNRSGNFAGRVGGFVLRPGLKTPTPHSAPNAATSPEYVPFTERFLFNFAAITSSLPQADRQHFYGSITRDLCDKYLTLFADFKFARTFFKSTLAPVPFVPDPFKRADGITPVSRGGISVPLSNPFNPFTTPNGFLPDGTPVTRGVRYRATEAGPREFIQTTYDYFFDGGVRGSLGEIGDYFKSWNYEFGVRYNANYHAQDSSGIVSKPGLRAALLDTDPRTAFNPFGRNVNTQAAIDRVLVTTHENGVATLTDEWFALSGDIISLPAGPLSFALGTEHRKETVNDQPDALNTSFDSIGGTDLEATRGSRDVWSYYGEVRIPITSSSWNVRGLYSLEIDIAERFEFYSDTDTAERPKFSVRYQPFDSSLTLRASYSEAFHAPNLSDLAPSAAESQFQLFDPKLGAPIFTRVLFGGQPNLRPEVAYGWNYGAVWTPKFITGLTLSVDFYHIDLRDRTNFVDTQFLLNANVASGGKQFPGQVIRDPETGEIDLIRNLVQNISRTITEGIDYEAIYAFDTARFGRGSFGTFTLTLNGNYISRYVAAINIGDSEHSYAGSTTFFGGYFPHTKLYTSLFYDVGGFDAGVTMHFVGQGSDYERPFANYHPRKIAEWTTFDSIVSYTFNLPSAAGETPVAGYAKDGGRTAATGDGKDKTAMPASTASYAICGWRAWLNGITITAGMNNVFDLDPPFGAQAFENGYEESTFDIKGRFWYASLKKRF